jgi:S-adenosylmethionine hydrolase
VAAGHDLPAELLDLTTVADAPATVWWVDNFGNCKTTLLPEEAARLNSAGLADLPRYPRLKDVPNGEAAVITGSSGYGTQRLLEIVVQGGRADEKLSLDAGAHVTA